MTQRRWKLVVSELGSSATLHESVVDAGDWMTALTRARAQIGERGGVPPGASCAVAPDGKVTILDAVARRQYMLAPTTDAAIAPTASPAPVPLETRKKSPKQTIAYMQSPLAGQGPSVAVGSAPASVAPPAAVSVAPPAAAKAPSVAPAPSAPKPEPEKAKPKHTIAYVPAAEAARAEPAQQTQPQQTQPEPAKPAEPVAKKRAPKHTVSYLPGAELPSSPPPPQAVPESAKVSPTTPPTAPPAPVEPAPRRSQPPSDGAELLYSRDAEPSAETPLSYRERTYVVAAGTSTDDAEMVLRRRFVDMRAELEARPKGKLVNMAVFDHRWEGRPQRPPLVVLQWKDWRGEPEVQRSDEGPVTPRSEPPPRPPSAPPPARAVSPPSQPPIGETPAPPAPAAAAPRPAPRAPVAQPPVAQPPVAQPPVAQPAIAATRAARQSTRTEAATRRAREATPLPDDRLSQAFEALQDLFFLGTPLEGADFVLHLLADLVPSEAAAICLYDINSNELRQVAVRGPGGEERRGDAIPPGAGLIGAAANEFAPLLVADVLADPRFDPTIDGLAGVVASAMAIAPSVHQGRLLAVIQLINRIGHAQFGKGDANVLAYVAEKLGEFLHEAGLSAGRPR